MPQVDVVSFISSPDWLNNLLACLLDDELLLSLDERQLAIIKANVIREIYSSPDVANIIKAKAAEVAQRLTSRGAK
jgi:hypothetical protein